MSDDEKKPIVKDSRVRVKPSHLTHLLPYVGQEGEVTDVYAAPDLWIKLDSGKDLQINSSGLELVTTAKKKMTEMVNAEPVLMEPAALDALVRQLCTS
jgi:hypothetical protein